MGIFSDLTKYASELEPEALSTFKQYLKEGKHADAINFAKNAIAKGAKEEAPVSQIARDSEGHLADQETFPTVQPKDNSQIHPQSETMNKPSSYEFIPAETPEQLPKGSEPQINQEVVAESKPPEAISAQQEGELDKETVQPSEEKRVSAKAEESAPEATPETKVPPALQSNETLDKLAKLPENSPLKTNKVKEYLKNNKLKVAVPAVGAAAIGTAMLGGGDNTAQPPTSNQASATTPTPDRAPASDEDHPLNVTGRVSPEGILAGQLAYELSKGQGESAPKIAATPKPAPTTQPSALDALTKMLNFEANGQQSGMADAIDKQNEALRDAKTNRYLGLIGAGAAKLNPAATGVESDYERAFKESGLPIEQYQKIQADQENDPRSGISSGMRDYLKTMGVNVSPNATAGQMKQVVPFIFKDVEAKQAQQAKHEDIKARSADLAQRRREGDQRHQESMAQTQANRDIIRQDKFDKKFDNSRENFYKQFNSFRGNIAVQRASEGLRNSEMAMQIINANPDYNQISHQDYNLLTSEIAKIATGGAATEASAHDVRAQTIMSKAKEFWQKVKGSPTGAELGDFVQKNKEYLQHLNEVNDRYVNEFHADTYRGYKKSLRPEDQDEFETTHPKVMQHFNQQGKPQSSNNPALGFDPNAAAAELARRRKNQ